MAKTKTEETTTTICDVEYKEIAEKTLKPCKPTAAMLAKGVEVGMFTQEQADQYAKKYGVK